MINMIKHLYVTGDSFAFGHGLPGYNGDMFNDELRNQCYSGIIANKLNIETYTNTSKPGGSNDRALRVLLEDIPAILKDTPAKDIFVNICLTSPSRIEFYSNLSNNYLRILPTFEIKGADPHSELWRLYTRYFLNVVEQVDRYIRQVMLIRLFLESLGIPYLIIQSFPFSDEFMNNLRSRKIDITPYLNELTFAGFCGALEENAFLSDYHPNSYGHQAWANYLIEHYFND